MLEHCEDRPDDIQHEGPGSDGDMEGSTEKMPHRAGRTHKAEIVDDGRASLDGWYMVLLGCMTDMAWTSGRSERRAKQQLRSRIRA